MDELIDTIRAATAADATPEARQAGAAACRTILAALDVAPGQALAVTPPPGPFAALAQLDTTQVLDLIIAKLQSMVVAPAASSSTVRLQLPLVPAPRRPTGGR